MHSGLLVPYFSWQRSHAVHHARTNHLDLGETHVPLRDTTPGGKAWQRWQETIGDEAFAIVVIAIRFLVGWPALPVDRRSRVARLGVSTNHFWPGWPFSAALFPGEWRRKVWLSDIGVVVMLGLLGWWTYAAGFLPVLAVYVGPYLVVNFWLVLYTWLQHTDVDVPHFDDEEWTWVKGAFMTVDRPYGAVLNFLHHHIGSTHVAHHMDARIPHYNAVKATRTLQENFPDLYRYDPTPIPQGTLESGDAMPRRVEGQRLAGRSPDDATEPVPQTPWSIAVLSWSDTERRFATGCGQAVSRKKSSKTMAASRSIWSASASAPRTGTTCFWSQLRTFLPVIDIHDD